MMALRNISTCAGGNILQHTISQPQLVVQAERNGQAEAGIQPDPEQLAFLFRTC